MDTDDDPSKVNQSVLKEHLKEAIGKPQESKEPGKGTLESDFASAEQIEAATRDIVDWQRQFHEAAEAMKTLWRKHLFTVGHKRLGRLLLGRPVKPYSESKVTKNS